MTGQLLRLVSKYTAQSDSSSHLLARASKVESVKDVFQSWSRSMSFTVEESSSVTRDCYPRASASQGKELSQHGYSMPRPAVGFPHFPLLRQHYPRQSVSRHPYVLTLGRRAVGIDEVGKCRTCTNQPLQRAPRRMSPEKRQ